MKRLGSSDSLGALMSMCPVTDEQSSRNNLVYGRDFRSMFDGLDEEACEEETGHVSEKKRRLSVHQVKALEKNFEVENKLEPERKVKLAQELGLQPRQVAVWFQNRRARWKTKQLERDYGVLKANYDALKHNFESLQHDNEALMKEIKELKSKLDEENTESNVSVKEEAMVSESEDGKHVVPTVTAMPIASLAGSDPDFNCNSFKAQTSSDSDSSAILNEGNSPNAANSSSGFLQNHHQLLISSSPTSSSFRFNCSSFPSPTSINCISFTEPREVMGGDSQKHQASAAAAAAAAAHHNQLVKLEEHDFFSGEEACNFFSDEQAPSLQYWGCPDQWT